MAKKDEKQKTEAKAKAAGKPEEQLSTRKKIIREIMSWVWVILAFLFIQSTLVQARVIPSGSMEQTLLIGDHLIVSRFGYDAEIPLTGIHWKLWRDFERQQVIVFRPPIAGGHDYIKRIIGVPGDKLEIKQGAVWINGKPLVEPYVAKPMDPDAHFPNESVVVPPEHYFVMGDNRGNSFDSRYWGFVPRENIIGSPLIIYMSVEANEDAWKPGHIGERFYAYANAAIRPSLIRWKRLFLTF